jgi:hypothetical protein
VIDENAEAAPDWSQTARSLSDAMLRDGGTTCYKVVSSERYWQILMWELLAAVLNVGKG